MPEFLLQLDSAALLWIQEHLRGAVLNHLLSIYTALGDVGMIWIVLSGLMLIGKKTRKAGLLALGAMLLGVICTNVVLKPLVARSRPWMTVEGLLPLVAEHDSNSFPSGHTCAAFAAACAWLRMLPWRWVGIVGVMMAALMGFSRLFVGVHFPSDVLAGALVGFLCSVAAWCIWKKIAEGKGLTA